MSLSAIDYLLVRVSPSCSTDMSLLVKFVIFTDNRTKLCDQEIRLCGSIVKGVGVLFSVLCWDGSANKHHVWITRSRNIVVLDVSDTFVMTSLGLKSNISYVLSSTSSYVPDYV